MQRNILVLALRALARKNKLHLSAMLICVLIMSMGIELILILSIIRLATPVAIGRRFKDVSSGLHWREVKTFGGEDCVVAAASAWPVYVEMRSESQQVLDDLCAPFPEWLSQFPVDLHHDEVMFFRRIGFPWKCFVGAWKKHIANGVVAQHTIASASGGIDQVEQLEELLIWRSAEVSPLDVRGLWGPTKPGYSKIPIGISWGGVFANLLLWCIVSYIAINAVIVYKTVYRLLKNRCWNCGYDRVCNTKCPECGEKNNMMSIDSERC